MQCKGGNWNVANGQVRLDAKGTTAVCRVKCKQDTGGYGTRRNALFSTFECRAVFDEYGAVVGAQSVAVEGFDRYQEICGYGCDPADLESDLGFTAGVDLSDPSCGSGFDIHKPNNVMPWDMCYGTCKDRQNNSHSTSKMISCMCDGRDERECAWKLRTPNYGYQDLDYSNYLPLVKDTTCQRSTYQITEIRGCLTYAFFV